VTHHKELAECDVWKYVVSFVLSTS